jgi:predicted metal-binding membrane protein
LHTAAHEPTGRREGIRITEPAVQVIENRPASSLLRHRPVGLVAVLGGATLATWAVTVARMRGMDAGPGTDLGALGWFLGVWVTMMAAMMLPSVAPMALLFARVSGERRRHGRSFVPTWVFLCGYLTAWTGYGLVAYGLFRLISAADIHALGWQAQGPLVAGGAIGAAGIYQLTPLKRSVYATAARRCTTYLAAGEKATAACS